MLSEVIMVRTGRTGVLIRRGSNVLLDTEEKPSEDTVKTYLQARKNVPDKCICQQKRPGNNEYFRNLHDFTSLHSKWLIFT